MLDMGNNRAIRPESLEVAEKKTRRSNPLSRKAVISKNHTDLVNVPEQEKAILIDAYHRRLQRFREDPLLQGRYKSSNLSEAVETWIGDKCLIAEIQLADALEDLEIGEEECMSASGHAEVLAMGQASKKQLQERIRSASEMKDAALGLASKYSSANINQNVNHRVTGTVIMQPTGFKPPVTPALPSPVDAETVEGEVESE